MSNMGEVIYDKDAIYFEMPDNIKKREGDEMIEMLQQFDGTLDDNISNTSLQLLSDSKVTLDIPDQQHQRARRPVPQENSKQIQSEFEDEKRKYKKDYEAKPEEIQNELSNELYGEDEVEFQSANSDFYDVEDSEESDNGVSLFNNSSKIKSTKEMETSDNNEEDTGIDTEGDTDVNMEDTDMDDTYMGDVDMEDQNSNDLDGLPDPLSEEASNEEYQDIEGTLKWKENLLQKALSHYSQNINLMKLVYEQEDDDIVPNKKIDLSDYEENDDEFFTLKPAKNKHANLNIVESSWFRDEDMIDFNTDEQAENILKSKFLPKSHIPDENDAMDDTDMYGDFEDLEKEPNEDQPEPQDEQDELKKRRKNF